MRGWNVKERSATSEWWPGAEWWTPSTSIAGCAERLRRGVGVTSGAPSSASTAAGRGWAPLRRRPAASGGPRGRSALLGSDCEAPPGAVHGEGAVERQPTRVSSWPPPASSIIHRIVVSSPPIESSALPQGLDGIAQPSTAQCGLHRCTFYRYLVQPTPPTLLGDLPAHPLRYGSAR